MAVTRIQEGGLGTDSFNLPITLNGTDGSSTDAGDNIVLDASASGVDAGERLLYEGIPPDFANISDDTSVLAGATLTVNDNGAISVASGGSVTIDSGATITNNGTASGFGGSDPTSADGDSLGTASLEWSDLYLADGGVVYFGNDQEITLTHSADTGLILKHTATADDKPIVLTLQTGETDIAANDVLGKIAFQAPDEGTGTDAVLVAGAIQVVSEGDFSSSNNAVTMEFHTAASEAAAAKAKLTSTGVFQVGAGAVGGPSISFTSDPDTGMFSVAGDELGIAVGGSRPIYSTNRKVCINDDATSEMSSGLTINQTSYDDESFALKSSDIAHGRTSLAETDTYYSIRKTHATAGGVQIRGFRENTSTNEGTIHFRGDGPATFTTTKTSGNWNAAAQFDSYGHDGSDAYADTTANGNVFSLRTYVSGGARFIFGVDEDGDIYQDGTTNNAFDAWDDAALLRSMQLQQSEDQYKKDRHPIELKDQIIKSRFDTNRYTKEHLEKARLIEVVSDEKWAGGERSLYNETVRGYLQTGAIWQNHEMIDALMEAIEAAMKDAGVNDFQTKYVKPRFVSRGLPTQILDWDGAIPSDVKIPDVAPKAFNG